MTLPVFTSACLQMWQRQCIQLELRMTMAGLHSCTHTTSPSLQHRKTKSCSPWPAAKTQTNYKGSYVFTLLHFSQLMLSPCGQNRVLCNRTAANRNHVFIQCLLGMLMLNHWSINCCSDFNWLKKDSMIIRERESKKKWYEKCTVCMSVYHSSIIYYFTS